MEIKKYLKDRKIAITIYGAVINVILSFLKIIIGIIGNSRALISDGFHTLSDLLSDIVIIVGIILGDIPSDETHNYSHKKIETFAELILGLLLIGVSVYIGVSSAIAIYYHHEIRPQLITIIAAFISIVSKEYLYRITKKVAKEENNNAILANAWHHRSDAFSSIPVFISLIIIQFFPSLHIIDAYISILIAFIIVRVGWQVSYTAFQKIIDVSPDKKIREQIYNIIGEHKEILDYHKVRMRYIGNKIYIDCHILVDENLSVKEAHHISTILKEEIFNSFENIFDVVIHIEPYEKKQSE
ncbi:MAG TPA: cation diffusion facilitator family transporter [bacterium]|nr:cation diffusion facilitator family transporter [bacterium]HOL47356.1 cation diffusion facilitator family transporter [bacterium]HPQ18911.1 cation diffusion facilitator family transporter [bacterium]